jgi:hypothetical protein
LSLTTAEKRFNDALNNLCAQTEKLSAAIKNKDWKPLLAVAEKRSGKITEKLQAQQKQYLKSKNKPLSTIFFVTSKKTI